MGKQDERDRRWIKEHRPGWQRLKQLREAIEEHRLMAEANAGRVGVEQWDAKLYAALDGKESP